MGRRCKICKTPIPYKNRLPLCSDHSYFVGPIWILNMRNWKWSFEERSLKNLKTNVGEGRERQLATLLIGALTNGNKNCDCEDQSRRQSLDRQ